MQSSSTYLSNIKHKNNNKNILLSLYKLIVKKSRKTLVMPAVTHTLHTVVYKRKKNSLRHIIRSEYQAHFFLYFDLI